MIIWLILSTSQNILVVRDFKLPTECMPLIFISACGLTLYYYGTLNAMSQGNLSIYYPIVRSSPIAIFIFSWLFLDTEYTDLTVFAIFLIVIGASMLQKSKFGFFVNNKALLFALMAMMGSAAYSLSDAITVQKIKPSLLLFYCYILVSLFLFAIFLRNNLQFFCAIIGVIKVLCYYCALNLNWTYTVYRLQVLFRIALIT